MHISWFYSGSPVAGFDALLTAYSGKDLASPRRSTVPLLAYWRDAESRVSEFAAGIGFSLGSSASLDFEHTLAPERGVGKASYTDLMLSSGDALVAIEAKATEPRYEDVATWLGKCPSANRKDVLKGWLTLLRDCTGCKCQASDVAKIPYQTIHRAASACKGNAESRFLVYQIFGGDEDKQDQYLRDLQSLGRVLGAGSPLRLRLAICAVRPRAQQTRLEALWDSGEHELAESVVAGLKSGDLLSVKLERAIAV